MLKQSQSLRLLQKISPQQIQFIKLLQIPVLSLEGRIKDELEVNPALEEGKEIPEENPSNELSREESSNQEEDKSFTEGQGESDSKEFNLDDYLSGEEASYKTRLQSSPDDDEYEAPVVAQISFYDRLVSQFGMLSIDENQRMLGEQLMGSIDEDGYLRRPIPNLINDLSFRYNVNLTEAQVNEVLKLIQGLDPPGVGARSLQECLILQLERKEKSNANKIAIQLLEKYFEEFTKKHFSKIQSGLGINEAELKEAYEIITHLNPKPGDSVSGTKHEIIVPDFILKVNEGKIDISLTGRNAPDLRVSRNYIKMFTSAQTELKKKNTEKAKETLEFIKNKIESAQWFIDAIKQRQFTLLNTMNTIAEVQEGFFLTGGDERSLKPMILKDIAEKIQMDISTVSRVANSKYVQTEFGIYPLKYFFSEGISTDDGTEVSNREVKKIIEEMIGNENKRKPLSDDKIAEDLNEKGYNIARRTVAKYRDMLNIPVARLRKEM